MRVPRGRGDYNRRIEFYRATVAQVEGGSLTRTWPSTPFAKRWAQTVPVPPSLLRDERFEDRQWVAKSWAGFRIPYDATLFGLLSANVTMRIKVADGRIYDIITFAELPDTRLKCIDLMGYVRADGAETVS